MTDAIPSPDAHLLANAITHTGLSVRVFARVELVRDSRTVFRWLAGPDTVLPEAVRQKCTEILRRPARAPEPEPDG